MAEVAASISANPLRRLPGVAIVLALLVVGFAVAAPGFLSRPNIANVLVQSTLLLLLSLPMTLVIMTEGLDLSMGAVLTLTSIVVALVSLSTGSMPLGLLAAIAVGIAFGLANGYLVARLNIPPFVATLGTLGMAQGLALIASDGQSVVGVPSKENYQPYETPVESRSCPTWEQALTLGK
jgi:ribose transport system permease protein